MTILDRSDGMLSVDLPAEGQQRVILEAARDTKTRLRGLHPKRSSLEEVFMSAIERQKSR